jgi:hypothetical protein
MFYEVDLLPASISHLCLVAAFYFQIPILFNESVSLLLKLMNVKSLGKLKGFYRDRFDLLQRGCLFGLENSAKILSL